MRKIYLAFIFCCFCYTGFATTWYTQAPGDAYDLASWNSARDGSGSAPSTFSDPTDLWIIKDSMFCSFPLIIAGSLTLDSSYFQGPTDSLTIGGNLSLNGNAILDAVGSGLLNIGGNLSVLDSSIITNQSSWTTIVFNNTSSTPATPQTVTWTSANGSAWGQLHILAGCSVQLLSNVLLPSNAIFPDSVDGTLICGNFVLNCNSSSYASTFQLDDFASIYTANPYGIDSSVVINGTLLYSPAANYVFNGTAAQLTGLLMPGTIDSGGSVTVNNITGVTLSQSTNFAGGSTLALTNGALTIGTNNLNLDVAATLAGAFSSSSMIVANGIGQVQKQFNSDSTFLFPIGDDAGNYSPITLIVSGGPFAPGAYAGVNVTHAKHPNNANITNYINRYWSVNISGVTGLIGAVSAATYVPADVTGTEANISMGQYTGALPWLKFGATDVGTHTLPFTIVTMPTSDFTGISTAGPTITSTANTAICTGGSAPLAVLSVATDSPFTYSWSPAAGLDVTTGTTVTATPDTTTTYTVTVTDANGFTGTATTTVTVNPLPNIYNVTGGGNFCSGTSGVHVGLDWSDSGAMYRLYLNDTMELGGPFAGTDTALDFGLDTLAGTYTVIATNAAGCTSNMDGGTTIIITPSVIPTISINPSILDTICQGTPVSFSSTITHGGEEPSYQWKVGGTVVSTGSSYAYTPVNGDVVSVRLISDTVCAIPDTVNASMTMSVSPPQTPTVYLSVSPNDTVCEGTGVVITASPGFGGTAPAFLWIKNTLIVGADSSFSYIPANDDNVYVIMQSNYFCRSATTAYSNVINMHVQTPIIPSVDIIALHGTTITRTQADTFVAVVANGGVNPSYQWYRNGSLIAGATSSIYTRPSFTNHDSISCMVTRHDVCSMSTINSVVITISTVGVFTPGGSSGDVIVYPNPNRGIFTIKGSLGSTADEEVSIEITDVLGQLVYKNNTTARNGNISEQVQLRNALPNGTYLLNLRSASGNNTIRFVIGE